jgi:hypothetical protein
MLVMIEDPSKDARGLGGVRAFVRCLNAADRGPSASEAQ